MAPGPPEFIIFEKYYEISPKITKFVANNFFSPLFMRKLSAVFFAILVWLGASAQDKTVRDDGMFNVFAIIGGKLTPEVIANTRVILPSNITYTTTPDSEYTFYYPYCGWFAACKSECLKVIFPDATEFVVDNQVLTRDDFYAFPDQLLTVVACDGKRMVAEIRKNVNDIDDGIPAFSAMTKASHVWAEATVGKFPIPENIVVNNPSTLPEDGFLNLDWEMTTTEAVAKLPAGAIKGWMLSMFGLYPEMNVLTKARELDYWWVSDAQITPVPASEVKTPTVAAIAAAAKVDPAKIRLIKFNGESFTVYTTIKN